MIKNYLILAFKNLQKQKVFSLVNILGLTVGITCCLLIYLFILNELSFDNFHKNGKDIYRVMRVGNHNGARVEIPYLSPPYGPTLKNDFPDAVVQTVRVMRDNDLISHDDVSFNERNILLTDSNFFSFFDFHLIRGNPDKVLNDPNSVVLTKSTAKKYFGSDDPIGRVLEFNKDQQLKVTGIAEDVPVNSHLQFDMIIPLELLRPMQPGWFTQWPNNGLFTYVQLLPKVDPSRLEKMFPAFMDKYLGEYYRSAGFSMGLTIKPLSEVYFSADRLDNIKHGNKKAVYIIMSIAVLILIIACINFVNMSTARATDRSKEVGIRKVLGALRGQLVRQFIFESMMFTTVACILSLGLAQLLMPAYDQLLGYHLPSFWTDYKTWIFILGVILSVGLLAGSYPALLSSSFSPIESLKGKMKTGSQGAFLRKSLVVFQFTISGLLVIAVIIMMSQMNYMENTDLGFNKEQTMIVRFDNMAIGRNKDQFKNDLERIPAVESVSLMSGEPGGFYDGYSFEAQGKPGENFLLNTEFTDFDYISTLGLKVIAGRSFSKDFSTDSTQAIMLNRNAATALGWTPEQAIGKWIKNKSQDSLRRTIVGVVENFHYSSMKETIGQLAISIGRDRRLALVRLKSPDLTKTVDAIKKAYVTAAPDYPFEYSFLDDRFDQLYKAEKRQQSVLSVFSVFAIVIACLGLFGLSSYSVVKRTKEIGVRRVIGSSVRNIVFLLSKDLLKPVLIGTLISIPLGYYAMNRWLEGFAYRVPIHWWVFALAALIAVLIAFITISYQSFKAAVTNPVKSLRTE